MRNEKDRPDVTRLAAIDELRSGLARAAAILCETRGHVGVRPCAFCTGMIVAPYSDENLVARGVSLAPGPEPREFISRIPGHEGEHISVNMETGDVTILGHAGVAPAAPPDGPSKETER